LGEILVGRGLVSGPDLTSALMDQLGSGLWAEIKRRHKSVRTDDEDQNGGQLAHIASVPDEAEVEEAEFEPFAEVEHEPEPVAVVELLPDPIAAGPEFEQIKADYTPPAEREPEPEPEPEPIAESDDALALRAELADARTDLEHLQEMLEDAMTALAALSAEAAAEQNAE
jgi:hypothetical protein